MEKKSDSSVILLTYKGKLLLMQQVDRPAIVNTTSWGFIEGKREKNASFEDTVLHVVAKQTNIMLTTAKFLSTHFFEQTNNYFYHAALSDANVNEIQRGEGQEINFYTLPELEKLPLTPSTKQIISEHKDIISKILQS